MKEIKFRFYDSNERSLIANVDVFDDSLFHYLARQTLVPCQYTGIKDVNGLEIYEGDILQHDFSPGRTEKIICDDENMLALIMKLRNYRNMSDLNDRFEVIGNIYQHPELLTPTI